MKQNPTLF